MASLDLHDLDCSRALDFKEFGAVVRAREPGYPTELTLAYRFQELDPNYTGTVLVKDYLVASLKDALARSSSRAVEVFQQWDEDGDGEIDKGEFRKAMVSLGFELTSRELESIFDELDFVDGSGALSYVELYNVLRKHNPLPEEIAKKEATLKARVQRQERKGTQLASKLGEGSAHTNRVDDVAEQLREILASSLKRVVDLFRKWDEDESGTIEKKEFRIALKSLGLDETNETIDALFDEFDDDGSGQLEYQELNKKLRKRAEIDDALKAGAAGEIQVKATNKIPKRDKSKEPPTSRSLHGVKLDVSKPVADQLIRAIKRSKARVLSIFREWDTDGDGMIDKQELHRALHQLGITHGEEAKSVVNELFDAADADKSGSIDFNELFAALRRNQYRARFADAPKEEDDEEKRLRRFEAPRGHPPLAQLPGGWRPIQQVVQPPESDTRPAWDPKAKRFLLSSSQSTSSLPQMKYPLGKSQLITPQKPLPDVSGTVPAPILPVYKPLYERKRVPANDSLLSRSSSSVTSLRQTSLGKSQSLAELPSSSSSSRKDKSRILSSNILDYTSDVALLDQLAIAIYESRSKVLHLYNEWDASGDGVLSKSEMLRGLQMLGITNDKDAKLAADELFDEMDKDGSGMIDLKEMFNSLRARVRDARSIKRSTRAKLAATEAAAADDAMVDVVPVTPASVAASVAEQRRPISPEELAAFPDAEEVLEQSRLDQWMTFYRLRPPGLRIGSEPSLLRRPRSLAKLREYSSTDAEWWHAAVESKLLPPPKPLPAVVAPEPPPQVTTKPLTKQVFWVEPI